MRVWQKSESFESKNVRKGWIDMRGLRHWLVLAVGAAALVAASLGSTRAAADTGKQVVVVPKGQAVQIAVVLDMSEPIGPLFAVGIQNAINLAVSLHPRIRGFPIQLNQSAAPCLPAEAPALNATVAQAVVDNHQNVAVLGHLCSFGFANTIFPTAPTCSPLTNDNAPSALSIYEKAGIVTINGSTTNPCLPLIGRTVFNATVVPEPVDFEEWYGKVKTLPLDRLWRQIYKFKFGKEPTDFADLYFDATNLLLTRIAQVSEVENGKLVVDRANLAKAVRNTTNFPGITCTISLDPGGYRINDLSRCSG